MKFSAFLISSSLSVAVSSHYLSESYKRIGGFNGITNVFIFGASYDSTNFPVPKGRSNLSTAWGYLWPMWLTESFNVGVAKNRVNYAIPGATTNKNIVKPAQIVPGFSDTGDVIDQISKFILDNNGQFHAPGWTGQNSLFFFPGSTTGNDIVNSWHGDGNNYVGYLAISLEQQFERLWAAGARNFVFLPVLPVEITPNTTNAANGGGGDAARAKTMVDNYQKKLDELANIKQYKYASEITLIRPDATTLLRNIRAAPKFGLYTKDLQVLDNYCLSNKANPCFAPDPYACVNQVYKNKPPCPYNAHQYAFVDDLHVSHFVHKEYANYILSQLGV